MKRGFFKKALIAGILSTFLASSPNINAQEITPKPSLEQTLVSTEININYQTGDKEKNLDYSKAYSRFYNGNLYTNFPGLTTSEETQVEDIMNDIKTYNINSYEGLINSSNNLSEDQKLVFLSAISDSLGYGSYDTHYYSIEGFSQEIFFEKLQDYLATGDPNPIGVCKHIASHIEQLANDIGIKTAAVTGIDRYGGGHVYDISKTDKGTAIIDYGGILLIDTKNIEKALEEYQKNANSIAFQHFFFNDNNLKYRLITKDGKNFLKFVGYDETSETLKKELLSNNKKSPDLKIDVNLEDYLTSAKISCFGFFINAGEIRGNSSSPIDNLTLAQIGYDNSFSICSINIEPSADFTFGNGGLHGITGDLKVNTNNKEGLNLASRIAGEISWMKDVSLFNDLVFEVGASYKIPIEDGTIEPYVIGQAALLPEDLGTDRFKPRFNEIRAGVLSKIQASNDINLLFDSYYLGRIWENELGGNVKIETKNLELDIGGSVGFSNYEFCPDKYNMNIGAKAIFGDFTIGAKYNLNGTNYDGEIENQSSFSVNGSLKF